MRLLCRFKSLISPLIKRFSHFLFLVQRQRPLQWRHFHYKYVSYKRVPSTQFSELLPCLLLLKNNHLKITNRPRKHILRWHVMPPFTPKGQWGQGRVPGRKSGGSFFDSALVHCVTLLGKYKQSKISCQPRKPLHTM